eukprot:9121333-Pyramimonas_sp.AAC.1
MEGRPYTETAMLKDPFQTASRGGVARALARRQGPGAPSTACPRLLQELPDETRHLGRRRAPRGPGGDPA